VNAELLRPLPFRDPNRVLQIAEKNDRLNLPSFGSSALNSLSWREQQQLGSSASSRPVWVAIQEPSFDLMQAIERNSDRTL
jgi:hypothetical protein